MRNDISRAEEARGKELPDRVGQELSGAQILWEALCRVGVDTVFGYPGGAIMPAYDAMERYPVHHVLVRHEQCAAHMADGFARASGRVGVAIATSGPGATNLVTGIATAMLDSIPMVCVTGQVPSHLLGSDAFQETDITGVTLPITKHNYLVTRAEDVAATVKEAFYVARSGRPGPVLIDLTKDAQLGSAVFLWDEAPASMPGYRPRHRPKDDEIEAAASLLSQAERPLIFCGHGVVASGSTEILTQLVEGSDAPVACTLLGLGGLPASHPRNLGMMGMHGESWVNHAIQEADVIMAVGMRFDDRVTGRVESYAPNARKIHIELDPAEINKNVPVEIPLVGDAKEILERLVPRVETKHRPKWLQRIEELQQDSGKRDVQRLPDTGKLLAAHVINDLWRFTNGEARIVTDVGQHQMWEAQYHPHERPRSLLTSGGLGTMGFALPAAMGAKMACPDDPTWVIVGDGGFQMTSMELVTCVQEQLDVKVAIINNGYLGMVRQWQEFFFDRRYVATPLLSPDFVKLAEAHGVKGMRVTSRSEMEAAVREAEATPGTVVIDFVVEKEDSVYPMVPAGAKLDEMIRRPAPEEDE